MLRPVIAGTVHFTSSDRLATLPANYTFTAGDAGTHMFGNGVTMKTIGHQTITVFDMSNHSITGSADVNVGPVPTFGRPLALTGNGGSGGRVNDAIAAHGKRTNARTAARALHRRQIAQAERAHDRAVAELEGKLRGAFLMAERLADGRFD